MKQKIFILSLSLFAIFAITSCKKQWDCKCNVYKGNDLVSHIDSYVEARDIPEGNEKCTAKGQAELDALNADTFECGLW